jgi:hypothetical protein
MVYAQALVAAGDIAGGTDQLRRSYEQIEAIKPPRPRAQLWREVADVLDAVGQRDEALRAYRNMADCLGLAAAPAVPVTAQVATRV